MKAISIVFLLLVAACGGSSGSDGAASCNSETCNGCCDNGTCVSGVLDGACGSRGVACAKCVGGQACYTDINAVSYINRTCTNMPFSSCTTEASLTLRYNMAINSQYCSVPSTHVACVVTYDIPMTSVPFIQATFPRCNVTQTSAGSWDVDCAAPCVNASNYCEATRSGSFREVCPHPMALPECDLYVLTYSTYPYTPQCTPYRVQASANESRGCWDTSPMCGNPPP